MYYKIICTYKSYFFIVANHYYQCFLYLCVNFISLCQLLHEATSFNPELLWVCVVRQVWNSSDFCLCLLGDVLFCLHFRSTGLSHGCWFSFSSRTLNVIHCLLASTASDQKSARTYFGSLEWNVSFLLLFPILSLCVQVRISLLWSYLEFLKLLGSVGYCVFYLGSFSHYFFK